MPCRACRHRLTSANNDDLVLAGTQRCSVSRGESSSVEESRSHYRGFELNVLSIRIMAMEDRLRTKRCESISLGDPMTYVSSRLSKLDDGSLARSLSHEFPELPSEPYIIARNQICQPSRVISTSTRFTNSRVSDAELQLRLDPLVFI